jgi:hypothetical protein
LADATLIEAAEIPKNADKIVLSILRIPANENRKNRGRVAKNPS